MLMLRRSQRRSISPTTRPPASARPAPDRPQPIQPQLRRSTFVNAAWKAKDWRPRTLKAFFAPARRFLHQQSFHSPANSESTNTPSATVESTAPAPNPPQAESGQPSLVALAPADAEEVPDSPDAHDQIYRKADESIFKVLGVMKEVYLNEPGQKRTSTWTARLRRFHEALTILIQQSVLSTIWIDSLPRDIGYQITQLLNELQTKIQADAETDASAATELVQFLDRLTQYDFRYRQRLLTEAKDAYANLNQLDALRLADHTLQVDPDCFEAHQLKSRTLYRLHRYDEALVSANAALATLPQNFQASNNLYSHNFHEDRGNILDALHRPREAAAAFASAMENGGKNPWRHYRAAVCLAKAGQFDQALVQIRNALESNENELSTKKLLDKKIEIQIRAGRFVQAATLAPQTTASQATIIFFLAGINAEHIEKQPQSALVWYKMCLTSAPGFHPARDALARLCSVHELATPDIPARPLLLRASDVNLDLEMAFKVFLSYNMAVAKLVLAQIDSQIDGLLAATSTTPAMAYLTYWKAITLEAIARHAQFSKHYTALASPSDPVATSTEEIVKFVNVGLTKSGVKDPRLLLTCAQLSFKLKRYDSALLFVTSASEAMNDIIQKEAVTRTTAPAGSTLTTLPAHPGTQLNRTQATIYHLKAEICSALHLYNESDEAFEQAVKYFRQLTTGSAIVNNVRVLLKLPLTPKSLQDAASRCEWALRTPPLAEENISIPNYRANIYSLMGHIKRLQYKFDEALRFLTAAEEIYPACIPTVMEQKRLVEEARRLFTEAQAQLKLTATAGPMIIEGSEAVEAQPAASEAEPAKPASQPAEDKATPFNISARIATLLGIRNKSATFAEAKSEDEKK